MDASTPASPAGTRSPLVVASVACMNCRRLKMKCTGSDNPPCDRCAKAGRECVVQRGGRVQDSININSDSDSRRRRPQLDVTFSQTAPRNQTSNIPSFQPVNGIGFGRENQVARFGNSVARTFFPDSSDRDDQGNSSAIQPQSLTSSSSSVMKDHSGPSTVEKSPDQRVPKRPKFGSGTLSLTQIASPNNAFEHVIGERDMKQLIDIFRTRLLNFIPLLDARDLDNAADVILRKKPLAYCICYVTARYVPGGESARSKMLPVVSAILQDKAFQPKNSDDEWVMLQALAVIYAYRTSVSSGSSSDGTLEISQPSVKSHIETYALKLSVHLSISGVRASVQADDPDITNTIAFKKYILWLWLFTMSHYHSIIHGTPPSIRQDSTIRAASELLGRINVGSRLSQVLAETELCLLWGNTTADVKWLNEWWCPPDVWGTPVDYIEQGFISQMNTSLNTWAGKWEAWFNSGPLEPGLEFSYRFTRFCLMMYLIRNLHMTGSKPNPTQVDAISRSISYALDLCQLFLDLGPSSREAARYMTDFGFIMISCSCLSIIQACETFHSAIKAPYQYLDKVEEVARLMKELAINSSHGPSSQSHNIMSKLTETCERMSAEGTAKSNGGADQCTPVGTRQNANNDPHLDMLVSFFPDTPHTRA